VSFLLLIPYSRLAVRFLDDVIDVNAYPMDSIEQMARGNRKIGLGVMGFADLLVDLGIAYDEPGASEVAEGVMARIAARAESASARLAAERGVFSGSVGSRVEARGLALRNATTTSIAPTGTLSILADCSGGIEPYFALAFVRHVLDGARLPETNPRFEAALRASGAWSDDLVAEVRQRGSLRGRRVPATGAVSRPPSTSRPSAISTSSRPSSATSTTPSRRRSTCPARRRPPTSARSTSPRGVAGSRASRCFARAARASPSSCAEMASTAPTRRLHGQRCD
jgi:hypothetical protein